MFRGMSGIGGSVGEEGIERGTGVGARVGEIEYSIRVGGTEATCGCKGAETETVEPVLKFT
jgi:hypothetical protein